MAVYKVIQDIEAEDKLLGPLTLKGLIYALTAGFLAFLNFKILVTSALGNFRWPLLLMFGLPMLLFGVLASPLGREQPTEIWLLSRVRFFLKPRKRVWDQTGISELVTVTAPPKIERTLVKGLDQTEVKGRLKILAATMDSRGWAVKNVNLNLSTAPNYQQARADSDRLISVTDIQQHSAPVDVRADDDIMDENNNPVAKLFSNLMLKKDAEHKNSIIEKMKGSDTVSQAKAPAKTRQPALRDEKLNKHAISKHKRPASTPMTEESQAAKLELAQSGNDLSVASIEKLANREPQARRVGSSEVEISLH